MDMQGVTNSAIAPIGEKSDDNNTCDTPVTLSQGSSDIFQKTWHLKMDKELSPVGKLAWVPNISLWGVSGLPFTSSH